MGSHKTEDCLDKVRQEVRDANPDIIYLKLELSTISNGKVRDMTGQPISVDYLHTKKDGTKVQKSEKTFITHSYCPFCGKKYKQ